MITTIILISLALAWLLWETDYMRIRLTIDETIDEYDRRILAEVELEQQAKDAAYQVWLDELHAPTYHYGPSPESTYTDNPQYKWMSVEDDLRTRRNGEAIYQRGI